jgi:hypothetical protein
MATAAFWQVISMMAPRAAARSALKLIPKQALSFSCADVGMVSVQLAVTDDRGQTASCSATITIQDNVAPQATCQNVTVQLDASGNGNTIAQSVDNGSSDAIASIFLSRPARRERNPDHNRYQR